MISGSRSIPFSSFRFLQITGAALKNAFGLIISETGALCRGDYQRTTYRALWMLITLPLLLVWQLGNWICLFLDELFFPSARNLQIGNPILIVGPPRSGTTHFHRILSAASTDFQTSPAWEVLLAPSILQKKICLGVIALDRRLGAKGKKAFHWLEKRLLQRFTDTHPGSLRDPEEDYFYLNPLFACTGWSIAFPSWGSLRTYMPGSEEVSVRQRRQALAFYVKCLQKQMYVHGTGKILLSKNASFSSWMDIMPDYFPNARWVICTRSPLETVPSMLSTAEKAQPGFFSETEDEGLLQVLHASMKAHYQVLFSEVPTLPSSRVMVVSQSELQHRLPQVLEVFSRKFQLPFETDFIAGMDALGERSSAHKSPHRYSLSDYGLDGLELISSCPELLTTLSSAE